MCDLTNFKVSIWRRGFLWFWYIYQAEISIQEIVFIPPLFHHEIKLQSSRFGHAPQGWPSSWAWCLHEFSVINFWVLLGYRYLLQIPHNFLPLGNQCFYG